LRRLAEFLLSDLLELRSWDLVVHFVSARSMERINKQFLNHEGSTDVITFDLREGYGEAEFEESDLAGEIFISVDDAIEQAGEFSTEWTEELARYIVHGILHLRGYDDLVPEKRRVMKRKENALVRKLRQKFPLRQISGAVRR
jgi:probable rRNA maturation factor